MREIIVNAKYALEGLWNPSCIDFRNVTGSTKLGNGTFT